MARAIRPLTRLHTGPPSQPKTAPDSGPLRRGRRWHAEYHLGGSPRPAAPTVHLVGNPGSGETGGGRDSTGENRGGESPAPLLASYDAIVCDLDGVVYRGAVALPHAVEVLTAAAGSGVRIAYATNNASRTPASVSRQLRELGLEVRDQEVVTSSQAGAERILALVGAGALVLAVGGEGVRDALVARELDVVNSAEVEGRQVDAVLQGYGAEVGWRDLAEAAYAVQGGAIWVATNDDSTLPTERGVAPGNGSLVAAVRAAVDSGPVVVGKPHTPLYELSASVLRTSPARTLAVGDRLDTDIRGANAAGMDALLVLTGVSSVTDLAYAAPGRRPRYIGLDLRCLFQPHPFPQGQSSSRAAGASWTCGDARIRLSADGRMSGLTAGSLENRLRAAITAIWSEMDHEHSSAERGRAAAVTADAVTAVSRMVQANASRSGRQ